MKCPRCEEKMTWQSDFDCEDYGCECGNGVVSYYSCNKCNVEIELTTDCKNGKEDDE